MIRLDLVQRDLSDYTSNPSIGIGLLFASSHGRCVASDEALAP